MSNNLLEQIALDNNLDLSDAKQAMQALELMKQAVNAQQEISIDLSTLNAEQFAEHFDYCFDKLNSFMTEENALFDVAAKAVKVANKRKNDLMSERAELSKNRDFITNRIAEIDKMLYVSKQREHVQNDVQNDVQTIVKSSSSIKRFSESLDLDFIAQSSSSRRNFLVQVLNSYARDNATLKMSDCISTLFKYFKVNANQITAINSMLTNDHDVCSKEDIDIIHDVKYSKKQYLLKSNDTVIA